MTEILDLHLTNTLHHFVDDRAESDDVFTAPTEYVRDIIRDDIKKRNEDIEDEVNELLMQSFASPLLPYDADFYKKERQRIKDKWGKSESVAT